MLNDLLEMIGRQHGEKSAGALEPSHGLAGMLQLSPSGYLLLAVPNALVRGFFSAIHEPGVELPSGPDGLNAHITVMRPEELDRIGGADRVTERGKTFRYSTGRLVTVRPSGWIGVERAWMIRVYSPELKALRRSYGLSDLPDNNRKDFHVTVAIRHKGVLSAGEIAKT